MAKYDDREPAPPPAAEPASSVQVPPVATLQTVVPHAEWCRYKVTNGHRPALVIVRGAATCNLLVFWDGTNDNGAELRGLGDIATWIPSVTVAKDEAGAKPGQCFF